MARLHAHTHTHTHTHTLTVNRAPRSNTPCCTAYYQLITTNLDSPSFDILRIDEGGKPSGMPDSQLWSIDVA